MAGPVMTSSSATTPVGTVKPFKQPFKAVATLSQKTGQITKPIDPAISKTLDFVYSGYTTVKTQVDKAPKVNPYLLIAAGLFLSCVVSISLLIPAILFFPVTIFLGIATSFALIALAPAFLIVAWVLISSAPMQDKVVVPTLDKVLTNKKMAKILLKE
ncbi:hypothetical protein NSK_002286 [Nannochloropsis salina CCMP1776]|uniref:Uncharacterized protein n=1 Tax=Nannochloropsis salina CCMP1776 TaxID=1027361 RepID=A0A4D9D4Z2_9STRA|nr:hypothetical protein NSK_002286 [Nannochloropsis salina CCMP1776]|eukprot:TFJ86632.1 hypothetical protein NSK_002286 [Nannochloropsis salina CCMP1776]